MGSIRPPRGERVPGALRASDAVRASTPRPRAAPPPGAPLPVDTCPTRRVMDVLADKWAPLALSALEPGTRRFQELRRALAGVTQKMLTQTLRTLERDGLVSRRVYATVPSRVEYTLTPLGRSLVAPLWGIREWANAHVAEVEAARRAWDATVGQAAADPP